MNSANKVLLKAAIDHYERMITRRREHTRIEGADLPSKSAIEEDLSNERLYLVRLYDKEQA